MATTGKNTTRPISRASTTPPSVTNTGSAARKGRSRIMGTPTREEALAKAPGKVKTADKAMLYLSEHCYAPDEAPLSLHTIAFILLQIAAASGSATDSDGIKAVAFLLEEIEIHGMAEALTNRLTAKMDDKVSEVSQILIDAKEQEVEYLKVQREELEGVREEVSEAAKLLVESKDELAGAQANLENAVGKMAECCTTAMKTIAEQVSNMASIASLEPRNPSATATTGTPNALPNHPHITDSFSYTHITGQHLPSTHATNISRNNNKHRQFTIQQTTREDDMGLDSLSELEVIAKLQLAYDTMTVNKDLAPKEVRFTSVCKMKKGGILFDVNTDAIADWLRIKDTQKDFTKHFSAMAVVQGYQFRVLAKFVPVSFDVESPHAISGIEEANYLMAGSIVEVGWIKRADRCSATQQVAHLKISFAKIDQANEAIEKGLSIQGKGVNVRQMIVEPQRCAKHQLYGHDNNRGAPHFTRNCTWTHNVCGLCGNMHRTSECSTTMLGSVQCANCKVVGREHCGHTVHSRTCPTFLEMKQRYDQRHGSQQYHFFVTDDTKTWEANPNTTSAPQAHSPTQDTQYYSTPPPNQLQRPAYSQPPPGLSGPPKQRTQQQAKANDSRPKGIQLSASNRVPMGQGRINRYYVIAGAIAEDDKVDKEIQATEGFNSKAPQKANKATAKPNQTWADATEAIFDPQPRQMTPVTPELTSTSNARHYSSSPLRFPSTASPASKPASTQETVSK